MTQLVIAEDMEMEVGEFLLAKRISETLIKHYPGFKWAVNVCRSIVDIRALDLSGEYGYTLHVNTEYSASDYDKKVVRAGGEILERFGQARGAIDHSKVDELPTNFAGDILFDRIGVKGVPLAPEPRQLVLAR